MKPYNKIWHYFIVACSLVLILHTGCNPAKRVAKQAAQYQQLVDEYTVSHPPVIDTDYVYTAGKTDSLYIPVPSIDTAAIKKIKDSLQAQYAGVAAGCTADINNAFDAGYTKARDEIKKQKVPGSKVDTVRRNITPTTYISSLKNTINSQAVEIKVLQAKKNYWWPFIICLFINALFICLLFKKR